LIPCFEVTNSETAGGGDFETLGDKVNEIKQKTDQLKLTIDQIENDNQKIKSRLGIIY
jgi:hypothetical protein